MSEEIGLEEAEKRAVHGAKAVTVKFVRMTSEELFQA